MKKLLALLPGIAGGMTSSSNKMKTHLLISFLLTGLVLLGMPSRGQQCALKGSVMEKGIGERVPYCKVLILKEGKPINGRMTNDWGYYCIDRLDPGTYDVEVSYGYQKITVEGIVLSPGEIKKLDFGYPDGIIFGLDPKYCPVCNMTSRVIPIHYGALNDRETRKASRGKLIHEEGKKGPCDPSWYCKRDEIKF